MLVLVWRVNLFSHSSHLSPVYWYRNPVSPVVLDFERVSVLSSTGMVVLVDAHVTETLLSSEQHCVG